MKKELLSKTLVAGIVVLFISMSIFSSAEKIDIITSRTTIYDGTLSGYVNNTSGNPIEGALVRVHFHETYEEDYSDEDGYYHVTNIPICYCLKNATCSKEGYETEWVLLSIVENTTYDFRLSCVSMQVDAGGPYLGYVYENIQFHGFATCGSPPYSWKWDFGDGGESDIQNPMHTYTEAGNYTVILNVTDSTDGPNSTVNDTTWALIWEPSPPPPPKITGPTSGTVGIAYEYTFLAADPYGEDLYYDIYWGDGQFEDWFGPFASGEGVTLSHAWSEEGTYSIRARVKYNYGVSDWAELLVTMPRNRATYNSLFLRFLEQFPILQKMLLLQR